MRGIVTATALLALIVSSAWMGYWAARILLGAQGRGPEAAFVGGLIMILVSLVFLLRQNREGRRAEVEARLRTLRTSSNWQENSAGPIHYSRTYPKTARRG